MFLCDWLIYTNTEVFCFFFFPSDYSVEESSCDGDENNPDAILVPWYALLLYNHPI